MLTLRGEVIPLLIATDPREVMERFKSNCSVNLLFKASVLPREPPSKEGTCVSENGTFREEALGERAANGVLLRLISLPFWFIFVFSISAGASADAELVLGE
jgi:hypothetical protein